MAWSSPYIAATGDVITAAEWNISSSDLNVLATFLPTYSVAAARVGSTPSSGTPVLLAQVFSSVPTLASGAFSISFPTPFPNGVVAISCTGASTASAVQWLTSGTLSTSGFAGTAFNNTGTTSSGAVRVDVIAIGF